MAGHTFLYPVFNEPSFVASFAGVRAGARVIEVDDVPSRFGTFSLSLTEIAETLDIGIKITDWLGVGVVVGGRGIVGSNLPALVYNGATYDYGGTLHTPLRIFRAEKTATQLTFVPYVTYSRGQVASFLFLVQNRPLTNISSLLQGNIGENIRTPFWTASYGGNFALAQAIGPYFGLQGEAGMGGFVISLEPFDAVAGVRGSSTVNGVQFNFGLVADVDGSPAGIPIAGLLEWEVARKISGADNVTNVAPDTVHNLAAGLYYSGRRNLQLGAAYALQLGLNRVEGDTGFSDRPTSHTIYFIMRYIF
jgi:hypothetical protein